jgi:uncharacterized protein
MQPWQSKVALVTGGTAGLGLAIARALATRGASVAIIGRDASRLLVAEQELSGLGAKVLPIPGDVTEEGFLASAVQQTCNELGRLDLACHAAGRSMRGEFLTTSLADFESLWRINTFAAIDLAQSTAAPLIESKGHLVLIGSLATCVAPRFLGAYPTSKFPLAALAQQLRLELGSRGLHTLLVLPGPLARDDANQRYENQASDLPDTALRPGGGAKVKAIDPHQLAERILEACGRRKPELVIPGKARLLFAINRLTTRWGDWLLQRNSG